MLTSRKQRSTASPLRVAVVPAVRKTTSTASAHSSTICWQIEQQPALLLVADLDAASRRRVRLLGPRGGHLHERGLGGVDERGGLAEVALEHRQLAPQRRLRAVLAARLQHLDVVVDGALGDADGHRRGLGDEQRHDRAAGVDRVLVHAAARELDDRAVGVGRGHGVVLGHEDGSSTTTRREPVPRMPSVSQLSTIE